MSFIVTATDATGSRSKLVCNIDISPAGPDWSGLLWAAKTEVVTNGGTAAFSPSSIALNNWSAAITIPNFNSTAIAQNTASITYDGPAVNCNIHVIATVNLDSNVPFASLIVQDWTAAILANEVYSLAGHPTGVYDVPFTIPDTGGIARVITVGIFCRCNGPIFGAAPDDISFTGVFSNV